jgi:flagellar motor switch protein FliN/FliY
LITTENLARFASLALPVETELGRCTMSVREILALAPGSLIRLSRSVGSPVDLYVGGVRFSSGEIVKAGDSIAVRIVFDKQKPA